MTVTREQINALLDAVPIDKYPEVFNLLQPLAQPAPATPPENSGGEVKFEFQARDTL
ncbi:hypothetical protein RAM80_01470 [Pseudomonas sp. App30]|uniref:hypothetical protein n=1 Tax=Pseudomonas sp. App30 TaxID=3068990 RepID=UPI003A802EA7